MYIGIDVGGTYTDAVIIKDNSLWRKIKKPTADDIVTGVLGALNEIMEGVNPAEIKRVVLSTTLVTNLIMQGQEEKTGLIVIPGPGAPLDLAAYPEGYAVTGAIDFRGRELVPVNEEEISTTISRLYDNGCRNIAVAGKFSNRNNVHEKRVLQKALGLFREDEVFLGHKVAGQLNFPRRIATTYLTALTRDKTLAFTQSISKALVEKGVDAPAYILKADGGAIPLAKVAAKPVETVFSGPAASTLGALALLPPDETAVVVDIGGTTTDLALILAGQPLMSSKGAVIRNFATHVHALSVNSIALGGDSTILVKDGKIDIASSRVGPAYCLGGPQPTVTDALSVAELTDFGSRKKAFEGLEIIAQSVGTNVENVAAEVLSMAQDKIVKAIEHMFISWEQEPAYRVWEVLQQKNARPNSVVGIGGASASLVPSIASKMAAKALIPEHAEVANALGAALAEPTVTITLYADTSNNTYFIAETGFQETLPSGLKSEEDMINLAKKELITDAEKNGLTFTAAKVVQSEVFNIIRGYTTMGRRFEVVVQTPWQIRPLGLKGAGQNA